MRRPESDTEFEHAARIGFYQRKGLFQGLSEVHLWHTAIDIGAHIGLISSDLAKLFARVYAFEPEPENFGCLIENTPENVFCHNVALGARKGLAGLGNPCDSNSGAWELVPGDSVKVYPLDKFKIDYVGFIKIDVQGAEMDVLVGAERTIREWTPAIMVETVIEGVENLSIHDLLSEYGYRFFSKTGKNSVFTPIERKKCD